MTKDYVIMKGEYYVCPSRTEPEFELDRDFANATKFTKDQAVDFVLMHENKKWKFRVVKV